MMVRMTLIVAALALLTVCTSTVVLRNPQTGEMAQCQMNGGSGGLIPHLKAEACADAYEKAGWERMS